MWRDYSISYLKKNKASSISIMIASLIAALFLSLICSVFYNIWQDRISQVIGSEGDWQGRIAGPVGAEDIETIKNFANVAKVVISTTQADLKTVDIYFDNMRNIYNDLPQIASLIGAPEAAINYHETLLSEYLIFNLQDEQPPLLLSFFLLVMVIASVSIILIIHNAFAVSMAARIHQMGILSSVGATPRQIKACLLQEAAALCILPILLGSVGGIGFCLGFVQFANSIGNEYQSSPAVLRYHPLVWIITILASCLTVFLSAWWPARKIGRITPLEAIRPAADQQLKRKKDSRILSLLFGIEGELAGNAMKARKKALRTSSISLTLSFLAFTMFLSFMTLSRISTKHTYFERYKEAWDIMVTVKDTPLSELSELSKISEMKGVDSLAAYQKATAYTVIKDQQLAPELKTLGGLPAVADSSAQPVGGDWIVQVPIIILDDTGFLEYCKKVGINPQLKGGILLNRIWDSVNSNYREPNYIPFIKEGMQGMELTDETGGKIGAEIPVFGYAAEPPVLREEYANFSLLQILPQSLWSEIAGTVQNVEPDTYLRILAGDDSNIYDLESKAKLILAGKYEIEAENRIQEEIRNEKIWDGYMLVVGALCGLLALIGIANIFSNTLGFLYQRKREFARYLSLGVTPAGVKKILWIEAFTIAGRPLLAALLPTAAFVLFAVKASYLQMSEFVKALPVVPFAAFVLLIILAVWAAYYIGGKRILGCDLIDSLKNDAMI